MLPQLHPRHPQSLRHLSLLLQYPSISFPFAFPLSFFSFLLLSPFSSFFFPSQIILVLHLPQSVQQLLLEESKTMQKTHILIQNHMIDPNKKSLLGYQLQEQAWSLIGVWGREGHQERQKEWRWMRFDAGWLSEQTQELLKGKAGWVMCDKGMRCEASLAGMGVVVIGKGRWPSLTEKSR